LKIPNAPPPNPPPTLLFGFNPKPSKKKRRGYKVQVRRKGIFGDIGGIFGTQEQAEQFAFSTTRGSLGASQRIIDVDTGSPITASLVPRDFYKSKKEAGVLIQRRGFKLGSMGERTEIGQFNKLRFGGI